jgi:hypothetical protein
LEQVVRDHCIHELVRFKGVLVGEELQGDGEGDAKA